MTKVLITRDLKEKDELILKLDAQGYELEGISFVSFEAIPFDEIPVTDWIFFYSKKGVHYFFSQPNDSDLIKNTKIAAIGKGTAAALIQMGRHVDFIGDGQPDQVAEAFLEQASGQSVLFPRAIHSNNSVRNQIDTYCNCYDLIVYKNSIVPQKLSKHYEIIIFTSPLNVVGYLSLNAIEKGTKVISIGPSTTQKLHEFNIQDTLEAAKPELDSLIELIIEKL